MFFDEKITKFAINSPRSRAFLKKAEMKKIICALLIVLCFQGIAQQTSILW